MGATLLLPMRPRCQWDSAASEDCPRLQRTVPSSEEPPVFRRPSRRQRPVPRLASQLLWRGWFSTFDGGQTDPRGEAAVMLSSLRSAVRPGQSRVSAYLRLKVGTRSRSLGRPTHQIYAVPARLRGQDAVAHGPGQRERLPVELFVDGARRLESLLRRGDRHPAAPYCIASHNP